MPAPQFDALRQRLAEIYHLAGIAALLEWDFEVMMPPKAAATRGDQMATLHARLHRETTDPEIGQLLDALEKDAASLTEDEAACVREARYDYDRATKLPERLVRELAKAQAEGYTAWEKARAASDFALFRPALERVLELTLESAERFGYKDSPYDALLEKYERGMTAKALRPLFAGLAENQKDLVARITASGHQPDTSWITGTWSREGQERVGRDVLAAMGFDFDGGRLDTAPHPFCTDFGPGDVRLTTRYHEDDPLSALYSSMHEAGHGLYEQGFDLKWSGTPLALAAGLGIHECNSRLWENVVGRSRAFTRFVLPRFRKAFPGRLDAVSEEQWHAAANRVEPSLIRVEADECTYNLHVVIRFEIEVDLIEGRLAVADVPERWNALYREYLGVDVPDAARGCLQDVHWSHALFGYFPTYALGNLYAAQIFEVFLQEHPDFWSDVEEGRFLTLREWLRERIHLVGRRRLGPETVRAISGRAPEPGPYLRYLEEKYTPLYALG